MIAKLIVGVVLVKATIATPLPMPMPMPMPMPQLIVKSQSNLFREQPGRQIDLSQVLPTKELFWLNLEEVKLYLLVAFYFVGSFHNRCFESHKNWGGCKLNKSVQHLLRATLLVLLSLVIHTCPKVNTSPGQILRVEIFLV